MSSTGSNCTDSGIYRTDCPCKKEIALSVSETFPPCSGCSSGVNWILVRATK